MTGRQALLCLCCFIILMILSLVVHWKHRSTMQAWVIGCSKFHSAECLKTPGKTGQLVKDPTRMQSHCCALIIGRSVEDVCGEGVQNTNCTCMDYLYCRLAVVTAISSNHFQEVQDMIHSAQKNVPNTDIYVYDLGLNEVERKTLSELCHVQVRTFSFNKYPPHFRNLALNEAWKPVVITELAQEYDVILYGDASLRILKPVKSELLPHLLEFPFVAAPRAGHPVIPVTPPQMYDYLGLNLTRIQALKAMPHTIQSTMMCVWATKLIKDKLLKHWVDCAMHEQCMSPEGYVRYTTCHFERVSQTNYGGEYVGCMRCQSILNILLYREFGREVWKTVQHQELNVAWTINRHPTHKFEGNLCPVTAWTPVSD